jgi:Gpi18-like mannosyltransferase
VIARDLVERLRDRDVALPLAVAFGVRIVVMLVATGTVIFYTAARHPHEFTGFSVANFWDRKDARWYLEIAEHGYTYSTVGQSRANFFPLYPALVSFFGPVAGILGLPAPYTVAGMAISWVCFGAACVALYKLAALKFNTQVALGAVTLIAVYPFSFYYGAVYTESLFLMLVAITFLAIERRNWWLAAAVAGIASGSRPPGLVLGGCVALAYLFVYLRDRRWLRWDLLALPLTLSGFLAYTLYCWIRFGEPLAYAKASHAGWHEGLQINGVLWAWHFISSPATWAIIRHPKAWVNPGYAKTTTDVAYLAIALLCLITLPFVWRRMGSPYAAYLLLGVLAPIIEFPNTNSLGRPLGVLFPAFFALAYLLRNRPILLYGLATCCLGALCLYATFFISGYGLS